MRNVDPHQTEEIKKKKVCTHVHDKPQFYNDEPARHQRESRQEQGFEEIQLSKRGVRSELPIRANDGYVVLM